LDIPDLLAAVDRTIGAAQFCHAAVVGGPTAGRGWIAGDESCCIEEERSMAEEIHAEIVANVLKVVGHEGDAVAEGDTVVILESMKMEIPVLTESAGTLTKIAVKEGDVVQEHDLIAVVE
jgi:acetyl-CoA carboxylase biotin carboxyl carrier protein